MSQTGTETGKIRIRQVDIIMGSLLLLILGVLIVPIPTTLLDILLVTSIAASVLVLLLTVQVQKPLQLSSFPSLLLLLTLFRLSLNVASTRLVLGNGFAGNVIQAFGDFVVGGNYVIGAVMFLILTTINFVVITKGSGRIAEVAARFTLDAMPGKQMSIDADLNSGIIDEKEAISRRKELSREADFYGAMDGASKFVRGDAIAGLIITAINIFGGFAVGMAQHGMTAKAALAKYTLLTVGDGLVAQIPALIVSTAAGMLVTRAASDATLGEEVGRQLFMKSKPLIMTGSILGIISLIPGLPFLPFMVLGGAMGGLGLILQKNSPEGDSSATDREVLGSDEQGRPEKTKALRQGGAKQIPAMSPMDIEIGFGLVPLVDKKQGGKLIDRIGLVRGQITEEFGFVLPPVNVRDNIRLKNNEYCIRIRGLEVVRDTVRPGMLLAINPSGDAKLEGFVAVREPAFGFEAYWIPEDKREFAESKGMTVVDCASVVTTHLAEEAKKHADEILTRQDVSDMIDGLKETHPSVVQELIPNKMTIGGVHRVLQGLLKERVSIRNLALVMETISDQVAKTQDTSFLVEFCRRALGGHICHSRLAVDGTLPAIGIHPEAEKMIKNAIHREGNDFGTLALEPGMARELLNEIKSSVQAAKTRGYDPVIMCSPLIRAHLRRLTEHDFRDLAIISFVEVPDSVKVNVLSMVAPPKLAEAEKVLMEA